MWLHRTTTLSSSRLDQPTPIKGTMRMRTMMSSLSLWRRQLIMPPRLAQSTIFSTMEWMEPVTIISHSNSSRRISRKWVSMNFSKTLKSVPPLQPSSNSNNHPIGECMANRNFRTILGTMEWLSNRISIASCHSNNLYTHSSSNPISISSLTILTLDMLLTTICMRPTTYCLSQFRLLTLVSLSIEGYQFYFGVKLWFTYYLSLFFFNHCNYWKNAH